MIDEIENEIETERYEKVSPLVEQTYEKISEVQAEQTALRAFYEGTTKGLKRFFERNWVSILISIGVAFILFLIYMRTVSVWIIKRKIRGLEFRKEKILEIIRGAQREYFQDGKLSEGIYNIKTKKLAELIRDIDRQIPMLLERLARFEKNKTRSFQSSSENVGRKKSKNRKFFQSFAQAWSNESKKFLIHFNKKLKRKQNRKKFSFINLFKKLRKKLK